MNGSVIKCQVMKRTGRFHTLTSMTRYARLSLPLIKLDGKQCIFLRTNIPELFFYTGERLVACLTGQNIFSLLLKPFPAGIMRRRRRWGGVLDARCYSVNRSF